MVKVFSGQRGCQRKRRRRVGKTWWVGCGHSRQEWKDLGETDSERPWGLHSYCLIHIVQFSCSVMSDSLRPHGLQHARLPCPPPIPRACSNSCPLNWWCHTTISFSIVPFSSFLQSFPASGPFPMNQFLTSGGQSIYIGGMLIHFILKSSQLLLMRERKY